MYLVDHTDVLWLAQWQHLHEPGRGADKPSRLLSPSLCPFRLAVHLSREGRCRGGHSLKEHLSPVCRSEKVIGQVEASQRGWILPTDYELDNAELVKITWTQLVWNIQLHTCIKYQLVHATVMWVHLDCYRFSVTTLWFPFWKLVFWNTALWLQITDM